MTKPALSKGENLPRNATAVVANVLSDMSEGELEARVAVAACYRLLVHYRLSDLRNGFVAARIPDEPAACLVGRFCWAEKSAAPVRAPEHLIEPIYAARRALLELVHDEGLQAKIALRPGDLLIADNYRVMHGRSAYRGRRHLRHCHIDRDEMYSRYRMACHRRGRTPVDSA